MKYRTILGMEIEHLQILMSFGFPWTEFPKDIEGEEYDKHSLRCHGKLKQISANNKKEGNERKLQEAMAIISPMMEMVV